MSEPCALNCFFANTGEQLKVQSTISECLTRYNKILLFLYIPDISDVRKFGLQVLRSEKKSMSHTKEGRMSLVGWQDIRWF